MDELPLYPDGAVDVVPKVVHDIVHNALGNDLIDVQRPDILVRMEEYGTLVVMEGGSGPKVRMGRHGPSAVSMIGLGVGLISSLGNSVDYMDKVRMVYTNQRLRLKGFESELSLVFQGGAIEADRTAISTMSLGTVLDFSVPRGFVTVYSQNECSYYNLPIIGDNETTVLNNPLSEVIELELQHEDSIILSKMKELPLVGKFKSTKGKIYAVGRRVYLFVIPFMGKTIVSVMTSAFGNKPESKGRIFPMRVLGKDKHLEYEVSMPSIVNLNIILDILRRFQNIPHNLRSEEHSTSIEIGFGVSAYLALDIARREFVPDRGPFSLWELIEQGPFVRKTLESIKSNYPELAINLRDSFPRMKIHK